MSSVSKNRASAILYSDSWRKPILDEFVTGVSKLTLVADPDGLLVEEKLARELRRRGFDLIEFDDSIEFRYAYESKYRSLWDRGDYTDLVVVLRLQDGELDSLPFDLLQRGRKLSFSLGELFPKLSYPVIEQLHRSMLDRIYEAQAKEKMKSLGDNATKDFILQHAFSIVSNIIVNEVDLLRLLLRLHYGKVQLPGILSERLVELLHGNKKFKGWLLSEIIPDDRSFFDFLQERWPVFLNTKYTLQDIETTVHSTEVREKAMADSGNLQFAGPSSLPFDHNDIRVYVDNLFLEGKLTPVAAKGVKVDTDSWVRSGLVLASDSDDDLRISRLLDLVEKELPAIGVSHSEWLSFAMKWAELTSLIHSSKSSDHIERSRQIGTTINVNFADWLNEHFASLSNLPPNKPAMLHHVPRRLARTLKDHKGNSVALLVVDGLALDQWVTLRTILQKQNNRLTIHESATFAWIPTLTSVSRQTIFAGKTPFYFPNSINSTNSEEKLWRQFWEGHGISRSEVFYKRGVGGGSVEELLDSIGAAKQGQVVGLVVDTVDKIMHGMQLGSAGMHNQISQWCQNGFLASLIENLQKRGFEVWLTSDHGNVECIGRGRPNEGVIAETRGERVRVYPTHELRSQVAKEFAFAHEWEPVGLPDKYYPLVVSGGDAFALHGETIVAHGGITVEEVIVPLVRFGRRVE